MKRSVLASILAVIGCLVPILIIAQEVGKYGDIPDPPRIEPLTIDEIRGDWKAEKIGNKESVEDDIVIRFKDEKSQKLIVEGKYKDWEADGAVADGKITFTRKPKAAEMSEKAPQWARDKIAAEGKLKWKLELKAESRYGQFVLEGKWYPGQYKWKEAADGTGTGQEASYLDEGRPVEVKFKREAAIIDVVVLNDQTGFANGRPLHPYPGLFRPPPHAEGDIKVPHTTFQASVLEIATRTLFIYGPNLPKDYSEKMELQSGDKTLGYSVRAFATDHDLDPDNKRLFKVGWDEAVKGLDEDTKKSVKKSAAMLVSVRFGQGVAPGLKNFALNKMEAAWRLRFGNDRACIRFVRDATANQTEVIASAYMPERIYVEIRTETPFPIEDIPLRAALNDKPIRWNGADTIVASHVSDEPTGDAYEVFHDDRPHEFIWKMVRVYRTPAIDISGESSPAGRNGYQLSVKAGDVFYAKLDDPYLLTATPPHGRVAIWEDPQRDDFGNFVLTWEAALRAAAALDGYSVKTAGNLQGKEAAAISNIVVFNFTLGNLRSASKRSFNDTISHWTSTYAPVFAWRFFFGDRGIMRETVSVTVREHAALLLFKDTFVRKMKQELDMLEKITKAKSNPDTKKAALRGWRDAIKPYAWDDSSPWQSIMVSGPNGDTRLSLALDDGYLASAFKGNRKDADEWSLKAVGEGLEKYKESIRFAIQRAKDCPDNDVKKLIELIGYGYEGLLPDLLPKMMRLTPAASGGGQIWEPDLNARYTLWNLHTVSDAIRAQEDLAKLDTQAVFVTASVLTLPFMFGEGAVCAIALWAFDGATLGIQLVSETIPELWEEYNREEIKFALGASIVLGTDRLNEAELKKTQWYTTVLSVLPSVMGFSMSSVQAIPRMQRAVAEARTAILISQVEKHGSEAFKRFTDVERTAFLTSVSEAETLKEMGATKLMKKSQERAAAAGEKLASEAGVKTATLKNRSATVEAIGNPAKSETAAVPERNYISLEEKSSKPATVKEGGKELTAKLDEKSTTLKAPDARAPTKPMSRAARDLDELEGLTTLRGDKDPEKNALNIETTMPDGTQQSFTLGKHRGKGAFATVYDVIFGKFKGDVVKFIWSGDIFRTEEQIAKDMIACGKRLTDAKIPHLAIREVPGCAGAKTPFVIQEKLPLGARAFGEGTDRNLIKAFLSQNGRGKATVKLFWQLKEAGLILEDARVVNLYWEEVNGEWICGILDVDRVIPFAERNTPLGKVIDWVEASVSGDTVKSLYAARRSKFANRADSALAFVNRTPKGKVGPYLPSAEVFMEKMFEHKGWIDCEFLDAAGNVTADVSKIKSVRYKDGLLSLDEIRELFPNFDDPARTKELDLTRPYHSSLLRVPAFIFRTAAVSTVSTRDLGQSQSQFPMVPKFFTEDLSLAAA